LLSEAVSVQLKGSTDVSVSGCEQMWATVSGTVTQWLGSQTGDQEALGLTFGCVAVANHSEQLARH